MLKIKMVGLNYQKPSNPIAENDMVIFKHEKDNPVDSQAIAIFNIDGEKIGYVATKKTISPNNRKNGCIDNVEFLKVLHGNNIGTVTMAKRAFGYAIIQ